MKTEINAPLSREYPRFHARPLADVQSFAPRSRVMHHDISLIEELSRTNTLSLLDHT
jgi:hypothetical protein